MTKKQEAKLIAGKVSELLKHIGYEGDATDFYWEHGTHLLTIRLKAMDR